MKPPTANSMRALITAEWRKARSTRLPWLLLAAGVAYSCAQDATLVLVSAHLLPGTPGTPDLLGQPDFITSLLGQVASAATLVLITAVMAMTSEFRHQTITTTFLATPRRTPVVAAKMVVMAALGAGTAVIAMACVTAVTAITLIPFDHASVTISAIAAVLGGAIVGLALTACLGVAIGALITNQVAAVVTALLTVMLVEPVVGVALPNVATWLPSGALNSTLGMTLRSDATGSMAAADLLPSWGGALLLMTYVVAFTAVASRTTLRRDIT